VADDGPAPAAPRDEDNIFRHGLVYRIWVGNEYGLGQTYPDDEHGYYKRNVYSDGPWKGMLIDGKAFTGIVMHPLHMHDTWGLENMTEDFDGHTVLSFRSGEHLFYLEEDGLRAKRLAEIEKNCYKNQSAAACDGASVQGDLHRRADYQPHRQLSADSI
jgi:hypothetical protein